jgi:hypothetical protein
MKRLRAIAADRDDVLEAESAKVRALADASAAASEEAAAEPAAE